MQKRLIIHIYCFALFLLHDCTLNLLLLFDFQIQELLYIQEINCTFFIRIEFLMNFDQLK